MRKLAIFLTGLAVGFIVAAVAVFVAADRVTFLGVKVSYGVVLAVVWILLVQAWLARFFQTKLASAGVALGWIGGTILMGLGTHAGDTALPAVTRSTVYLILGAIAVAMGSTLPVLRKPSEKL